MPVPAILNSLPNDGFFFICVRSCWGRIFWETDAQHCKRPHCHLTRRSPKNKMQVRIAPAVLDSFCCTDSLGTAQLLGRGEQRLLHSRDLATGAVFPHRCFWVEENLLGCKGAGRMVYGHHAARPRSLHCKGAQEKPWVSAQVSLWKGLYL